MLHRIYKYKIVASDQVVVMPNSFEVLSVAWQGDGLYIWVKFPVKSNFDKPDISSQCRFKSVATGESVDLDGFKFLDTVQLPNGLVFHVFMEIH